MSHALLMRLPARCARAHSGSHSLELSVPMNRVAVFTLLVTCACGSAARVDVSTDGGSADGGSSVVDAGVVLTAGQSGSTAVFAGAHMTGGNRQVDAPVTLPTGLFTKITLHWKLSCPPNGCDPWDRIAELHVVRKDALGKDETVEIARLITPYHVGSTWDYDVTELAPVLTGQQTFRLFVDTWVDGWMVDVTIDYEGGVPARIPTEILNVWHVPNAVYGDPSQPSAAVFPAQNVTRAENESLTLRTIMTGHGQGNFQNCAEFCPRTHTVQVGDQAVPLALWRSDCGSNPVQPQGGSWQYPRAGWCPGADVQPITAEVTQAVAPGATTPVTFQLQDYTNTCRPNAGVNGVCQSCAGGRDCNYNENGHTQPFYDTSIQLIRFRVP